MGQITATRNLVATKVVRLAGQWKKCRKVSSKVRQELSVELAYSYIICHTIYIYNIYIYIYIYIPLYTNWPITNADLPHVIIQYILYFICQKLYWTVSGQLSNIGYIGQFQNEATDILRTRYRRTKAVSLYLMKILSIFLNLRKMLICFRIGWFL